MAERERETIVTTDGGGGGGGMILAIVLLIALIVVLFLVFGRGLIGGLFERLRRLGVLDDSLIVVTADHGESLFDDGFLGHGHALNAQQTRIPFIISAPGQALPRPIGLSDMRALILNAAGAPLASRAEGRVFQYLGELDRPGTIGIVEAGGLWTRFDLFREALWRDEAPGWVPYRRLDAAGRERAHRLIDIWARERWLRRVAEGRQG